MFLLGMFVFSFLYLICKYVHSVLKRTGWSTIGRGQPDPIANARPHLFVYDGSVVC